MKPEDQIKALAELDGLAERYAAEQKWNEGTVAFSSSIPHYLYSYDAIIPLIQKQDYGIRFKMHQNRSLSFMVTPAKLCEALLMVTGKWKE